MTVWRFFGLAALLLALLLAVLISFASTWLRLGLSVYDIEHVAFTSLDVGFSRTELTELKIGNPISQKVDVIIVDYSLPMLMGGQVDRIRIAGLRADLDLDEILQEGVLSSEDSSPALSPLGIIANELIVEQSLINFDTSFGRVAIPFSGEIETNEDRIDFQVSSDDANREEAVGDIDIALDLSGRIPLDKPPTFDSVETSGEISIQIVEALRPNLERSLDGEGRITFGIKNGNFEASTAGLDFVVRNPALDIEHLHGTLTAKAHLEIKGNAEALNGHLTFVLDDLNWSNERYQLQDLAFDQTLAVKMDNEILTLLIEEQGRASIGKVAVIDKVESGWFTVRFHQDEAPLLRLDTKNGDWQHQLHLEIDPVRIETPTGQWWARVEDLNLSATGNLARIEHGKISIGQGRADWPASNLALAGIESELHLMENGALSDRTIPFAIRSIRPLEEPRLFAPFRLDAELSPSAGSSTATGQLTSRADPDIVIDFSGSYEQPNDKAALSFDLPVLRFSETGLQPSDLSPVLLDVVEDTSGRMALTGNVAWEAGNLSSSMDLLIEELGLSIGPARLERVNTLFQFDSLLPPTTPIDQELAIALLDIGLPLTDGLVSMQLRPNGDLAVDQLSWQLADGGVKAAPFTFGSDVQDLTMVLDVDQLDLNKLLALTELDGLGGEGRIDGTLPLTINENGVIVADGKLEATDAGILRYRPDETPSALKAGGESIGLVLQALEDFHYDNLDISLNGRTDGETDIKLHLRGANPDLYDGHPIEFNLDLKGDLTNLIRANLSNYQIPDRIRERLQGFGQ